MRFRTPLVFAWVLTMALPRSHGLIAEADGTSAAPLRLGVAGLVHGHVLGFLDHSLNRSDIQIVGIAEPDQQLSSRYASRYGLSRDLLFRSLEEMLEKTHPQAVV